MASLSTCHLERVVLDDNLVKSCQLGCLVHWGKTAIIFVGHCNNMSIVKCGLSVMSDF